MERWQPGDVILAEDVTVRKGPIMVIPQIVVADTPEYLALATLAGTTCFIRDEPNWRDLSVSERVLLYQEAELHRPWTERGWTRPVLTLLPTGAAHSIRLHFEANWDLRFWYVNLQTPTLRSQTGISSSDHALDIVITPSLAWSWKDEEEFGLLVDAGYFTPEEAAAIRAEGERVITRLEAREWPFNEPWPQWRPDPSWVAPKVSEYWQPGD